MESQIPKAQFLHNEYVPILPGGLTRCSVLLLISAYHMIVDLFMLLIALGQYEVSLGVYITTSSFRNSRGEYKNRHYLSFADRRSIIVQVEISGSAVDVEKKDICGS